MEITSGKSSRELKSISSISFTLTNSCNIQCSFCPRTLYGVKERQINRAVLESIISCAKKIEEVQILGLGEPLVSNNFLRIITELKETGIYLSLTTNGTLLSQNVCQRLCQEKVNEIVISLQGASSKTHEGEKDSKFEVILENVKRLVAIKRDLGTQLPHLSFNFVGLIDNIKELPAVVELAHSVGVDQVYVANVVPFTRKTCELHLHQNRSLAAQYINAAHEIANNRGVTLTVYASLSPDPMACRWLTRPHIGLDGDVYPCNFIGAQDGLKGIETIWYNGVDIQIDVSSFRLGNILKNDIDEIWNSRKAVELRNISVQNLEQDSSRIWEPTLYIELIRRYSGKTLTPYEVCRICPHRFKITH